MSPIGLSRSAAISTVLLTLCSITHAQQVPKYDPGLQSAPPKARQVTLELLATPVREGNTLIQVAFEDRRRGKSLVIAGAKGPQLLRDDGVAPDRQPLDGLYSAVVKLDVERFNQDRQRRYKLAQRYDSAPIFSGRELKGFKKIRLERPTDLVAGVPVVVDWAGGFWTIVDPYRELLITAPSVVEDPSRTWEPCTGAGTPMGAWTFGKLMTEIANEPATGINPSDFVEHWVSQWKTNLTINTFSVPNRAVGAQALLDMWPKLPDGRLDLAQAPFRLLAIVNRQDLRDNMSYGSSGSGGEARLVFGAVMCENLPGTILSYGGEPEMEFTTIFEYEVPFGTCFGARSWANQWRNLGTLVTGSAAYNAALQAITDQFTLRDVMPSRLPNRSAINQVRTNEFALHDPPVDSMWQMREATLRKVAPNAGFLEHSTIAQTPSRGPPAGANVGPFINANVASLLAGTHVVPLQYPAGSPFRGGYIDVGAGHPWDPSGVPNTEARFRFSLATCDSCHTAETDTRFLHIAPRTIGTASALSDFLTGADMPKTDPVSGVDRTFHELLDRQEKLEETANLLCFKAPDLVETFPIDEFFFLPHEPALPH